MKEVKQYVQTVAKRLGAAFSLESFKMEQEVEFWALAAEHLSQKGYPNFSDIVEWMDILYQAPVHFVYIKEDANKLKLFHRSVLSDNLSSKFALDQLSNEKRNEKVAQFERRLDNLENHLRITEDMKEMGFNSFPIGKCYGIPLYDEEEFWGMYCIGPYVENPETITPRLSIIGRILSGWLIEEYQSTTRQAQQTIEKKVNESLGTLESGKLNISGYAKVLLQHLTNVKKAEMAVLVKLAETPEIIAEANVDEEFIEEIKQYGGSSNDSEALAGYLNDQLEQGNQDGEKVVLESMGEQAENTFLLVGLLPAEEQVFKDSETYEVIVETLQNLFTYRKQNLRITERIIDTYYQMIREIEQIRDNKEYHTNRMVALCSTFADYFNMESQEKEDITLTAKLHDIGYLSVFQLRGKRTVGDDLEHPVLGYNLVQKLSIPEEVKEGIKTHHEWVNGSGTPRALTGDEIPWTGKVVGLFEFVINFIETNRDDQSKKEDEWIDELTSLLLERADVQFDMVLIPTVMEMIKDLGWNELCKLGEK